jgi:hypothetical protein
MKFVINCQIKAPPIYPNGGADGFDPAHEI